MNIFHREGLFFTSDTHFNHANIIRFCSRPFETVEEMNEQLSLRWNEVVAPDDTVFHLGDFALGGSAVWTKVLDRLNGKIHLIMGNHDLKNLSQGFMGRFEEVTMQRYIQVGKVSLYLNHHPFLCFEGGQRDNCWQLFGHVHTCPNNTGVDVDRLPLLYPTQYDVGVDNNDYRPVSFLEVERRIFRQIEKAGKIIKGCNSEN